MRDAALEGPISKASCGLVTVVRMNIVPASPVILKSSTAAP